ncbi:aliphatic sulfonates import ATP-binding protein SsuB [Campylobacterota bacterium]|nr:aliphatic sulfonates import ATP-binding protein SsuB [Campylobacterota bacterium]
MVIELQNLSKTFQSNGREVKALEGIDLSIKDGEFVSIIGASGCGKSTLLRIIGGLDSDYSGSATFQGESIRSPSRKRGFIFQDHRLLPWLTVEDNIRFSLPKGTPNIDELVRSKLAIVNLTGFEKSYPRQLSGGMAQRVAVARALANSPKVLLLDEPFGALDAITKIKLQDEIVNIWQREKITMILVTHDIDEAVYLGERVVVMNAGSVQAIHKIDLSLPKNRVSPEFAYQKEGIYKAFFGDVELPFAYAI